MDNQQIGLEPDKTEDFYQWKKVNNNDFSSWDYLFGIANVESAIAFTKLFWPDFVEHEGGIFLQEVFNLEIYEQWKSQLGNDINAIERVVNHQHIEDLLPGSEKVNADNLLYLGKTIVQMWQSRLKLLYPNKSFNVSCQQDENTVVVMFNQAFKVESRHPSLPDYYNGVWI